MRYTIALFAFVAAVAFAQDDTNIIEDAGNELGEIAEDGVAIVTEGLAGAATSLIEEVTSEETDAPEEVEVDSDEDSDVEAVVVDSDEDSDVEVVEGEDEEEAAAIAAIPVLGAGIAGALVIVGML